MVLSEIASEGLSLCLLRTGPTHASAVALVTTHSSLTGFLDVSESAQTLKSCQMMAGVVHQKSKDLFRFI